MTYYDTSYPPSLWETPAPPPLATGATAGTPGTFTPSGSTVPTNASELASVTATPATAWTAGNYVVVGGSNYYWNGTAWVAGIAAVAQSQREVTKHAE